MLEHQEHHSVADFELVKVLISENVEHLVCSKIPNTEALIHRVLGDNFPVEVINLDEVRILKHEIVKQSFTSGVSFDQICLADAPALHGTEIWAISILLDAHYEYGVVHLVQESRLDCFPLALVEQ